MSTERKTGSESLKNHNGKTYIGAPIGYEHNWNYTGCTWQETKREPSKWDILLKAIKTKQHSGASGGPDIGTTYHWLVLADQYATKLTDQSYNIEMRGIKLKIGHKRPYWKHYSNEYANNEENKESENMIKRWAEEYLKRLQPSQARLEI